MTKKWKIGFIAGILTAIGFSLLTLYFNGKKEGTAYVDMPVLYDSFEMKKDLEKKLKETQQVRQFMLDSLRLELQRLNSAFSAKAAVDTSDLRFFNQKRENYLLREKQFNEDNAALADQYTSQIWKQINQYTKDYGKSHGYTYVFGAQGEGTLMYADASMDITDELKVYINSRYKGEQK